MEMPKIHIAVDDMRPAIEEAVQKMLSLKRTTERPTEEGFYWLINPEETEHGIVMIRRGARDRLYIKYHGSHVLFWLDEFPSGPPVCEWAGPIPLPVGWPLPIE